MSILSRHTSRPLRRRSGSSRTAKRRGLTLVEILVAMTLTAAVFAAITHQLIETSRLSLRITRTLEHSRNAREFIDTLSADIRAAQVVILHPDFSTRDTTARDGQTGNYLILHRLRPDGTITRTIGYYVVAMGREGQAIYRHDSAAGDGAAGVLPLPGTSGRHRLLKRAVRLSSSGHLFTCTRDRGVSIEGEFGTVDTANSSRSEYIRCTLSSRS